MLLAACGGGAFRSSLPSARAPSAGGTLVSGGRVAVTFSLKVPPAGAPAVVALAVDAGTRAQQNAALSLATGAPGCTNPAPSATCAVVLELTPGAHTFDVAANGKPLVAGFPFRAASGAENAVRIALQGAPAAVAVLPAPNQDVQGTQSSGYDLYGFFKADGIAKFDRTFFAAATDADGAYLVGPGAPMLSFASSDPATWSNGVPASENPNAFTVAALSYDAASPRARFVVTARAADGTSATASVPVRIAARNAPRVYVVNHLGGAPCAGGSAAGSIAVFDEQGNPLRTPAAFEGLCGATGLAYVPRLQRLYAAQESGSAILAFDLTGKGVETPGGFPNLSSPLGIAYDAARDRLLAGNFNAAPTVYDLAGNQLAVPGSWNEREGVAPYLPYGILADQRTGRVYVADSGNNRVTAYDANGNALFSWPTAYGASGIAQDAASGELFLTDAYHTVQVFDEFGHVKPRPCGTASYGCADGGPWANAHAPMGIARNPGNGWFYLTNYANDTITVYDANGNQVATAGSGFRAPPAGTTNGPIGIAIVP